MPDNPKNTRKVDVDTSPPINRREAFRRIAILGAGMVLPQLLSECSEDKSPVYASNNYVSLIYASGGYYSGYSSAYSSAYGSYGSYASAYSSAYGSYGSYASAYSR